MNSLTKTQTAIFTLLLHILLLGDHITRIYLFEFYIDPVRHRAVQFNGYPKLNPIKGVWNEIKKRSKNKHKTALRNSVSDIWYAIPRKTITNLYDSIPDRVNAVFSAHGRPTQYRCCVKKWHNGN